MLRRMLMIAAALEEELETAKSLCPDIRKIQAEKTKLWEGVLHGKTVLLLRTGVGPRRAAERLQEALQVVKPSRILVIGYAGALDPRVKLGSLVAVGKAMALRMHDELPGWEHACIEEEFELTPCEEFAPITTSAGLSAVDGNVLTSAHVLGNPAHKRILREKFHATIVDMETAALARIARSEGIPLGCVRAVSDEAGDTFLTPFSYDPSAGIPTRAKQLMDAGMMDTYREWKVHSAAAKACLFRFLSAYLIRD